jgi:peptidoglycan/LPS O-acetylase OafA/YrhL
VSTTPTVPSPDIGTQERRPSGAPTRQRKAGIDLVRAIALLRVVTYHSVGLPYAMTWFAAMPLMFFIAGRFMEASLDREAAPACLRRRFVRVLVPLAPYAVLILVVYARAGLLDQVHASNVVSYFVPLFSFPGPSGPVAADDPLGWTFVGLWYLQNYMLFVLLSPLLRRALRSAPRLLAGALAVLWVAALATGTSGRLVTFLVAWTAGMATTVWPSIGRRRTTWGATAIAALAAGTVVFVSLTGPDPSPLQARWCVVAVTLLGAGWISASMALAPQLDAVAARPLISPVVRWLNARAVSVYLWHFPAYAIGAWVVHQVMGDAWGVPGGALALAIAAPLTFVFATLAGGLEDVAARRPVRLVPV